MDGRGTVGREWDGGEVELFEEALEKAFVFEFFDNILENFDS
jgi:hypothetical protein